jgi:hypothetical protein
MLFTSFFNPLCMLFLTAQLNRSTGNSKFDEAIQRSEVTTRIRPRTDSCAVGSNVSETYDDIKKLYTPAEVATKSSNITDNSKPKAHERAEILVPPHPFPKHF